MTRLDSGKLRTAPAIHSTNQVVGTERRLQPARLRKNIRNLTGLESSDMMT